MMHVYSPSGLGSVLGTLHFVFALSIIVGAVLLVMWASKNLKKNDLKTLVELLLVIGVVGSLVVGIAGSYMGAGKAYRGGNHMYMDSMQGLQWIETNQAPGQQL